MIGEIRDAETADIAIRAAMTGHLVFSTLHTNSSCGAVSRLIDMNCEPFILASTLSLIIAQRLVRTLCPDCKQSRQAARSEIEFLQPTPDQNATVFEPSGCIRCLNTGYRGIFEMLAIAVSRKLLARGHGQIAVRYVRQALSLARQQFGEQSSQALTAQILLSKATNLTGDARSALALATLSDSQATDLKDSELQSQAKAAVAEVLFSKQRFQQASEYYASAFNFAQNASEQRSFC